MLALQCAAQNYDWGRKAQDSEVAQLAKLNGTVVDETKPYAELWMGTHPSGPSVVLATGETLKHWIERHPGSLGEKIQQRFGSELPYLFKVLSVRTALSIQAHPDKALAEKLHGSHPQHYKDNNHKPEMAIAISEFEALCGFVSPPEIVEVVQIPELSECIRHEAVEAVVKSVGEDKQALRAAFTALMTCQADKVASAIRRLVARLEAAKAERELTRREQLTLRLNTQYPDDVGVLSSYFLNYVALPAGHAIYLAANEPHAYIAGEIMEVMATSDNVIRAGLTPKFKHVDVLCSSLTYKQGLPEVLEGSQLGDHVRVYRPPFEEFELHAVTIKGGNRTTLPVNPGPMLLLVQRGAGHATATASYEAEGLTAEASLARGGVFFIPASATVTITAVADLTIWAAACNANFFTLFDVANEEAPGKAAPAEQLVAA